MGFNDYSGASDLYYGAVGAIDGWLCCTEKPRDVNNLADYFSGRYQRYRYNVQAVCDANLCFLYISFAAPGSCSDLLELTMKCHKVQKWIDGLPDPYYIIGDNTYALSNKLLIPFQGKKKIYIYIIGVPITSIYHN